MRMRKRVNGESRLMLIREECVFPAQSGTLIMAHAGCTVKTYHHPQLEKHDRIALWVLLAWQMQFDMSSAGP